jgi:SAM-dependent methyltransferase
MAEKGTALSQTRVRWDARATSVSSLPEVVATGNYNLDQKTKEFIRGSIIDLLSASANRDVCLDAACGVGLYFPLLHEVFRKVIGLDLSPKVLERMPDELRASPRLELMNGSMTDIIIPDDIVGAVFCRYTFQCLPAGPIPTVLEEFHRVLRPGGVAVIHFKNCQHLLYKLGAVRRRFIPWRHKSSDDRSTLEGLAEHEQFVAGNIYLRPWSWYIAQCRAAGFEVEKEFSWQLFFWNLLKK